MIWCAEVPGWSGKEGEEGDEVRWGHRRGGQGGEEAGFREEAKNKGAERLLRMGAGGEAGKG